MARTDPKQHACSAGGGCDALRLGVALEARSSITGPCGLTEDRLDDGLDFGQQVRQIAVAVFHGEVVKRYRRWVELAATAHAVSG